MTTHNRHALLPWYSCKGDAEFRAVFLATYAPRNKSETDIIIGLALVHEALVRFKPLHDALRLQPDLPAAELRRCFPEQRQFLRSVQALRGCRKSVLKLCRDRLADLKFDHDVLMLLWKSARWDAGSAQKPAGNRGKSNQICDTRR